MLPWLIFFLGFLITSAIGATLVGLSRGDRWGLDESRHLNLMLNTRILDTGIFENPNYWYLLILCLGISGLGAFLAGMSSRGRARLVMPRRPDRIGFIMHLARISFLLGCAWIAVRVLTGLPNAPTEIWSAWTGSFEKHYEVRYEIMEILGRYEQGLAYSGLLTLLAFPLHRALIQLRQWSSWIEVIVWFGLYAFIAILLVQKLFISYSLLVAGMAVLSAGSLQKYWGRLTLLGTAIFMVIHLSMGTFIENWSLTSTIDHLLGRSADAYPYVFSIGPVHNFSLGQYLVGSILGGPGFLGQPASYNLSVYDLMYPKGGGAMAMAAPVWSYCDVGLGGAALTMLLIALICAVTARISRAVDQSILIWSLYLLCLVQLYHLTQMPVVGILFWGYGISHGLVLLGLIALVNHRLMYLQSAKTPRPVHATDSS